jgi:pimeloyl-ACP methyl ester carboxylesterase
MVILRLRRPFLVTSGLQQHRLLSVFTACLLTLPFAASAEHRMINIGDRRLSIDCDGEPRDTPTIVLIAGGGRTAKDWAKVQPAVSNFARVCSYDRAGFGESDKVTAKVQPVEEVVDDLHELLKASGEKGPYIMAPHSIAGIYVRRFVTKYPGETAGLIFVDSSHEEQSLRLHELDPKGPGLDEMTAQLGFFVKPGQHLEWRTELPLIVLCHGKPYPRRPQMTEEQWSSWDRIWREFQEDVAKRSPNGQFRLAEESGHFIQLDQPDLVIQAIRDLLRTH